MFFDIFLYSTAQQKVKSIPFNKYLVSTGLNGKDKKYKCTLLSRIFYFIIKGNKYLRLIMTSRDESEESNI